MNSDANSTDPRIQRSRLAVREAVLQMLSVGRPFNSLTVSEVASAAQITRKTFYARYGSLEEVVRELAYDMFVQAAASMSDQRLYEATIGKEMPALVFKALQEDQRTLSPLITQCPGSLIIEPGGEVFKLLLDRLVGLKRYTPLSNFHRDYLTQVVASTVHGIMVVWIKRDCRDSAQELADMFIDLMGPGFDNLLKKTAL